MGAVGVVSTLVSVVDSTVVVVSEGVVASLELDATKVGSLSALGVTFSSISFLIDSLKATAATAGGADAAATTIGAAVVDSLEADAATTSDSLDLSDRKDSFLAMAALTSAMKSVDVEGIRGGVGGTEWADPVAGRVFVKAGGGGTDSLAAAVAFTVRGADADSFDSSSSGSWYVGTLCSLPCCRRSSNSARMPFLALVGADI